MRLLYAKTHTLGSFEGTKIPPYAILSHTWGSDEVTYQDITGTVIQQRLIAKSHSLLDLDSVDDDEEASPRQKKGYPKIKLTCSQALHDGLEWVWIDTCCIDKSSSSELSEAINSMFQWYKKAAICYVFLDDVSCEDLEPSDGVAPNRLDILQSAKWFARGWTLQELIAPEKINFFSPVPEKLEWRFIGSKESESNYLAIITGVDRVVLMDPSLLSTVSVARRMSWAASRQTTREEDIAYCLLGIFQVNMPLLYGEGLNAFVRLQEEILKISEDESLFAWTDAKTTFDQQQNDGILAIHPSAFNNSSRIVPYASKLKPYTMTNRGLRYEARLIPLNDYEKTDSCILHCRSEDAFESSISIAIEKDLSTGKYRRSRDRSLRPINYHVANSTPVKTIYIHRFGLLQTREVRHCYLRHYPESYGFQFEAAVAYSIKFEPSISLGLDRSKEYTPAKDSFTWNVKDRALVSSPTKYGYFSALQFTRASFEDRKLNTIGFIVLLRLPSHHSRLESETLPGAVLIPIMRTPNNSFVHQPLQAGFQRIQSCESTLETEDGIISAWLTKENQFGHDIFVLDITYKQLLDLNARKKKNQVLSLPEIRIFDSQGLNVTQNSKDEVGNRD
jgi:Heterokaryon incompatibility protein (HET)